MDEIPDKHRCYLFIENVERWIPLHPYVLLEQCPICHHPRGLIFDGEQYLDPHIGHRVTLTQQL
jgi:hypothetical protein